jgi:hypothetical protein
MPPDPRQAPDAGRLDVILQSLCVWSAAVNFDPNFRIPRDALINLSYLLALARRQAEALRWTEAKRTGPCLFCGTELFRPHGADCELGKLLAEVQP